MYSPGLYKYRGLYVLYIPTVHAFGSVNLRTLFWYRHTHMTFPPTGYPMHNSTITSFAWSRMNELSLYIKKISHCYLGVLFKNNNDTLLIKRFKGYHCQSNIPLYKWMDTWKLNLYSDSDWLPFILIPSYFMIHNILLLFLLFS